MALNDIQLNSALLTEMYRDSLVDINEMGHQKTSTHPITDRGVRENKDQVSEQTGWKYLGNFKKNILLIVRYPIATYLPDDQMNFLTSILGACNLGLADVAIVNISNAPSPLYQELQNEFRSAVTIFFGVTPDELQMPVNFPEFQIQPFNQCVFLHAPTLEKLESDKLLKSRLWVCLRRIFNLP